MSWWPGRGCAEVVVNISEATVCQHITHHEIVTSTQISYTVNKRSSPSFTAIVRSTSVELSRKGSSRMVLIRYELEVFELEVWGAVGSVR